jgi:glycosyltransferase involved in cell wall biosynthesis
MISIIIPTYRNPEYLDICLKSAIEQQYYKNEIIVAVDGFIEESQKVLDKYKDSINTLDLGQNQGMQQSLNLAVMNATNEIIFVVNDDNVFGEHYDEEIKKLLTDREKSVLTVNQIEPSGPGIFNFPVKDLGKNPSEFKYEEFISYSNLIKKEEITIDGGIFPFAMYKKYYMAAGGFDTMYQSPFICDWDFFLKLDLMGLGFIRTHNAYLYHFGSTATKNGKEGAKFRASEGPAADIFRYKWGIDPMLYENNSHSPKGKFKRGIQF